ncbi:MAG TPA: hypothetical protein VFK13_01230 [Gemmatimonadaceae bacterium]|nr:hypothetical protein [Gemmatimonadaceae bacterium]
MHRSRASRFAAAFMTVLFGFQLWLAGSGMACIMPSAAMQPATVRAASMAMPAGRRVAVSDRPAMSAHSPGMPHQMPCDQQMSMPMCQAMGPCVTALIAPPVSAIAVQRSTPSRVVAMVVLTPPSQTFPPELPPPRA